MVFVKIPTCKLHILGESEALELCAEGGIVGDVISGDLTCRFEGWCEKSVRDSKLSKRRPDDVRTNMFRSTIER